MRRDGQMRSKHDGGHLVCLERVKNYGQGRSNPRRIFATAYAMVVKNGTVWILQRHQESKLVQACVRMGTYTNDAPGARNAPATRIVKPMTLFACLGQGSPSIRSQSARAECSTPVGLHVERVSSTRSRSGELKTGPNHISSSGPPKLREHPPQL